MSHWLRLYTTLNVTTGRLEVGVANQATTKSELLQHAPEQPPRIKIGTTIHCKSINLPISPQHRWEVAPGSTNLQFKMM